MKQARKAFTLVELAIVLVIIGFLLAMGMKGTELIKSAKLQTEAYKFKKIAAGIGSFYNKYNYLPGDGRVGLVSSEDGGGYIYSPQDGIIQFWESGYALNQLEDFGAIDDSTRKIIDTPYFFSAGGWVGVDQPSGTNWVTIYYFNPGKPWGSIDDMKNSQDFGTGAFTTLIIAQYQNERVTIKEDPDGTPGSGDEKDLNGDGDTDDTWTYWQPKNVRSGPADYNVNELDGKVDRSAGWNWGNLRSALRYDQESGKYYRLNEELSDSDSDGRPDASTTDGHNPNYPGYYSWTKSQNFVGYKIW